MISFDLLRYRGILVVRPESALEAGDFHKLAQAVDPYIADRGALTGLLIDASSFPGWESFAALIEHLKFVRDHHRKIRRVAAVTESSILKFAPKIAAHFAQPEIKVFGSGERAEALAWLESGNQ